MKSVGSREAKLVKSNKEEEETDGEPNHSDAKRSEFQICQIPCEINLWRPQSHKSALGARSLDSVTPQRY